MTAAAFPLMEANAERGDWYELTGRIVVHGVECFVEPAPSFFPVLHAYERSAVHNRVTEMVRTIKRVANEAAVRDWYGPGSLPVSNETVRNAIAFARLIPNVYPDPDVLAHPDGEIAFEWYRGPRAVLTFSIGPGSTIHFAGTFAKGRVHGAEELQGAVSSALDQGLRRLYSQVSENPIETTAS